MWRISPAAYEQAVAAGELGPDHVAENLRVGKAWDVLARILADGLVPATGAARAIAGGEVLPEDLPDYGGTRVLSPAVVREVAAQLSALGDADVEDRYRTVDFTGSYGARDGVHTRPVERYVAAFREVRDFYAAAAQAGEAMALWLA
jgi:hypothetical protein